MRQPTNFLDEIPDLVSKCHGFDFAVILVVSLDVFLCWFDKAVDHFEVGGFSTTGFTQKDQSLSLRNV